MATLLFVIILSLFIGLGLPDSLFGSAWPAIYRQLNLPISYANYVTTLISLGTVISSLFASKLVCKLGTGLVCALSTLLTALTMLLFSLGDNIIWFCLLSMPLGFGAGAIDASLNNYMALNYSSVHMGLVHCFYGIGVSVSPLFMSLALAKTDSWQKGYLIVVVILAIIAFCAFFALPLWKKVSNKNNEGEQPKQRALSLLTLAKMPAVRTAWLLFFISVALEFTCGIWGCTYLVQAEGLSESLSAGFLTFYYAGMTTGRFTSGIATKWINPLKVVYMGFGVVGVAIIILLLPVAPILKGIGLFLIGFGNGPTFPNLTYLTPIYFGKDISSSVISTQMAFCNLGILIMPPVFGFVGQWLGIWVFPIFIAVLYLIMVVSIIFYVKRAKSFKCKI